LSFLRSFESLASLRSLQVAKNSDGFDEAKPSSVFPVPSMLFPGIRGKIFAPPDVLDAPADSRLLALICGSIPQGFQE